MKVEQHVREGAIRFWSAVFHLKRAWHVIFFNITKGTDQAIFMNLVRSFSKIDLTFFSVGKIAVLIVLQCFTDNLQLSCFF